MAWFWVELSFVNSITHQQYYYPQQRVCLVGVSACCVLRPAVHAYIYIFGAHDCGKTRKIRQPPASVCLSGVVSPWRKNDPGHRKHERCYFLFRPFRPQADANGAAAAPAQAPAPAGDTAAGAGAPTAEGGEKKLSKVYTRRLRSCCSNRASILLYVRRILCSLLQDV